MAVYSITGYFNTGFGSGNIPDSPAVLRLATSKVFPSNWLLQNKDLTTTRLNATWSEVENIDYVAIGNSYYFVVGIKMQTEVCAELTLQLDGLTTAGGINALSFTDGWCKRAHTGNDTLFANNIPEPFQPAQDLVIDGVKKIGTNPDYLTLISATVDLYNIEKVADEYLDSGGGIACYVPTIPKAKFETEVVISTPQGITTNKLPNTTLYYHTADNAGGYDDLTPALQTLRSLGLDTAITGSYSVPREWAIFSGYSEGIRTLHGLGGSEVSGIPYVYGSAKNKKVYSLFNMYTIIATANGSSVTKDGHILYNNDQSPELFAISNPAPNGYPALQFLYNEGRRCFAMENGVVGESWLNAPIAYGQVSGSLVQKQQYANREALQTANRQFDAVGGIANVIGKAVSGDVGGLISGIWGTATSQAMGEVSQMNQRAEFETTQSFVVPEIQFPQGVVNQMATGNGFLVYRVRLSDNDVARLDKFLTMYGYAQSKPLEKSDFTNRRYFNYVQADGVNVGGNIGLRIREMIAQQLSGGVRIWHTLPNLSYYNNNPIK